MEVIEKLKRKNNDFKGGQKKDGQEVKKRLPGRSRKKRNGS
jgi:hypothetical protein